MSTKIKDSDKEVLQLKAFAEARITKTPLQYDRVKVTVDLNCKVLDAYKRELFSEWQIAVNQAGRELPFTAEELNRYIDGLVCLRVDYVNGHRVSVMPTDGIAVPSFLSLILSNLGLARDTSMGVELYPEVEQPYTVDPDFMWKISRMIRLITNLGIEYAEGYLRSRDGSFEFMSMTLLGDYVRTWTKESHPVYALLASVVGLRGIEAVLSPRIVYGMVDHMSSLIRHVVAVKGS